MKLLAQKKSCNQLKEIAPLYHTTRHYQRQQQRATTIAVPVGYFVIVLIRYEWWKWHSYAISTKKIIIIRSKTRSKNFRAAFTIYTPRHCRRRRLQAHICLWPTLKHILWMWLSGERWTVIRTAVTSQRQSNNHNNKCSELRSEAKRFSGVLNFERSIGNKRTRERTRIGYLLTPPHPLHFSSRTIVRNTNNFCSWAISVACASCVG